MKMAKDLIPGGLADNKPRSKFDPKQLEMGRKVEREHTDDPKKAKEIATDHLEEFGNYYTALNKMEKELKEKEASRRLNSCISKYANVYARCVLGSK